MLCLYGGWFASILLSILLYSGFALDTDLALQTRKFVGNSRVPYLVRYLPNIFQNIMLLCLANFSRYGTFKIILGLDSNLDPY